MHACFYFGKSSQFLYGYFFGKLDSWASSFSCLFSASFWDKFFLLPVTLVKVFQSGEIKIWNTLDYLNAFIAYFALIGALLLGSYLLVRFFRNQFPGLGFNWNSFKYFYFITIGIFFTIVFFGGRYFGVEVLDKSQSFWYTGIYSLTILIFGLRRIKIKPTRYIKFQTWSLILIQALPLFIFPEILLPDTENREF